MCRLAHRDLLTFVFQVLSLALGSKAFWNNRKWIHFTDPPNKFLWLNSNHSLKPWTLQVRTVRGIWRWLPAKVSGSHLILLILVAYWSVVWFKGGWLGRITRIISSNVCSCPWGLWGNLGYEKDRQWVIGDLRFPNTSGEWLCPWIVYMMKEQKVAC